jgi:hypothetical protein
MRKGFLVVVAAAWVTMMIAPGAMAAGLAPASSPVHRWHNVSPAGSGALAQPLNSVSCYSHTACLAIGDQQTGAISRIWTGTKWNTKFSRLPEQASQVSCATANSCTAIGQASAAGRLVAVAEHWDGSSWRMQQPVNPAGSNETAFNAISCPAANSCTAIGAYLGAKQPFIPIAERWNGKRWTFQTVPGPPGKSFNGFYGISCASVRSCVAVGQYQHGVFADVWNGARWTAQLVGKPSPVPNFVSGISCSSSTACMAVGPGFGARWNGATWQIVRPARPKNSYAALESVSCTSAVNCEAVGNSDDGTGLVAEQWNGKKWAIQGNVAAPDGIQYASLGGVSCGTPVNCIAVGSYQPETGGPHLLAFHYS